MKKSTAILIFLCFGGVVITAWIIGRLTGALSYYSFATDSNAPTHKQGDLFLASNLKTPGYGDFVCFKNIDTKNDMYIYRLIGKPNDLIEIKDGILYRNSNKLDEPYAWNEYILSQKQYAGLEGYLAKNGNYTDLPHDTSYVVRLTDNEYKRYHLNAPKATIPRGEADDMMIPQFKSKRYSVDNFGPIKVPADSYFLLGDNRHNALDCRYRGFVKLTDVTGTKLGN